MALDAVLSRIEQLQGLAQIVRAPTAPPGLFAQALTDATAAGAAGAAGAAPATTFTPDGAVGAVPGGGAAGPSGLAWPVPPGPTTGRFGEWRGDHAHSGIDIAHPTGTPVGAAAEGEVVSAGVQGGYGNCVVVRHPDGRETLYAHLHTIDVAAGDRVRGGQLVGTVGSTGHSTGPHLHFEVRVDGEPVDPRPLLPGR